MLPPEWLPTSRTGPCSGMWPSPRTSPRNHSEDSSHRPGSSSRIASGSRSSRSAIAVLRLGDELQRAAQSRALAEEVDQQLVDLLGALDLRHVAAAVEHDLPGAGQSLGHD